MEGFERDLDGRDRKKTALGEKFMFGNLTETWPSVHMKISGQQPVTEFPPDS